MNRYDEFRRPALFMLDVNFAKTTPITNRVRLQVRLEAFNLLNSPQYDERQYGTDTRQRRLRAHQSQLHRAVGLPALRPDGLPTDFLVTTIGDAAKRGVPDADHPGRRTPSGHPRQTVRPLSAYSVLPIAELPKTSSGV